MKESAYSMPLYFVPHAGREQARSAVRSVHVEPQVVLACHGGDAGKIVDDAGVGRARGGHHRGERRRVAVGHDGGTEGITGQLVIVGGHGQRVHLKHP
jgi:hypothetical protein